MERIARPVEDLPGHEGGSERDGLEALPAATT